MNNKLFCVIFAGPVGSSKSPISNYLSYKFNLPIFGKDPIRSEVIEDKGFLDIEEVNFRTDKRLTEIAGKKASIIIDTSVDRDWEKFYSMCQKTGLKIFVISVDISIEKLAELYKHKGYSESLIRIGEIFEDHQIFLGKYQHVVNCSITDENFERRLELCAAELEKWLENN